MTFFSQSFQYQGKGHQRGRGKFKQMEECLYFKYMSKEVDQNKLQGGVVWQGGGSGMGGWWWWGLEGCFASMGCAPQFERQVQMARMCRSVRGWVGMDGVLGAGGTEVSVHAGTQWGQGWGLCGREGRPVPHTRKRRKKNKQGPTAAPSAEVDCVLLWKHGYTRAL